MKVNRRVLIAASLIAIISISSVTYASVSNAPEVSKNVDKNMSIFRNFDVGIKVKVEEQLNVSKLLEKDLAIQTTTKGPQILIIHTHPQEEYAGDKKGSVLDVGDELERVLEENYKVSVLHYKDEKNTQVSVVGAYERMEPIIEDILKENPSIQVIIDLQRDGAVEPSATLMNGKSTAKINVVSGLNMDQNIGTIGSSKTYSNPYIEDNFSFSAQMKCKSDELTPNLIPYVLVKPYRYNLHLVPKSLVVDIGNNNDTLEEAINAIQPFTEVLAEVLNLEKVTK
ncbi:MAG: stage II sporulation protein P [Zhenhengia sp.]|uniref:stage II sporulation protein P n=1 Tax=Zhenhengia sp. TaxID=2944208 RepID=UPI002906A443|nr:stage II sporulation protein P [Clostridiales bacterium]MDU6974385.1 stage II sporulation protein P [Clostridiales bacterium]